MRLSLKKGAHAVMSRAAYRKFGASRSFFARCGIPRPYLDREVYITTDSQEIGRVPHVRQGVRGPKTMGAAHRPLLLKASLTTNNRAAAFPQPNPHKPIPP